MATHGFAHEDLQLVGMALRYKWPPPKPETARRYAARVDNLATAPDVPDDLSLLAIRVRDAMSKTSLRAIETAVRVREATAEPGGIGRAEFAEGLARRVAAFEQGRLGFDGPLSAADRDVAEPSPGSPVAAPVSPSCTFAHGRNGTKADASADADNRQRAAAQQPPSMGAGHNTPYVPGPGDAEGVGGVVTRVLQLPEGIGGKRQRAADSPEGIGTDPPDAVAGGATPEAGVCPGAGGPTGEMTGGAGNLPPDLLELAKRCLSGK